MPIKCRFRLELCRSGSFVPHQMCWSLLCTATPDAVLPTGSAIADVSPLSDQIEEKALKRVCQSLKKSAKVRVWPCLQCTVCIDSMLEGQQVRRLPCAHVFHTNCIDHWLLTRRKCPLCNLNIIRHFGLSETRDGDTESDEASQTFSLRQL
jgi:hypothetical protein